jgi:hypothetical protein
VFVHRGVSFPFIHDLAKLLGQLERSGVKIPKYVKQADELSEFAVAANLRVFGFGSVVSCLMSSGTWIVNSARLSGAMRQNAHAAIRREECSGFFTISASAEAAATAPGPML